MHRDIKGPNVMLTKGAEIRLIDFGKTSHSARINYCIYFDIDQSASSLTPVK